MEIAGIWGVIAFLAVWGMFHEAIVRSNNRFHGRHPEDPRGEVGCGFYLFLIAALYLLAILLG